MKDFLWLKILLPILSKSQFKEGQKYPQLRSIYPTQKLWEIILKSVLPQEVFVSWSESNLL